MFCKTILILLFHCHARLSIEFEHVLFQFIWSDEGEVEHHSDQVALGSIIIFAVVTVNNIRSSVIQIGREILEILMVSWVS